MFDFAEQDRVLKEFLARHVRPYGEETDDYDRPPFAADIKEGKNDPIYNAHSYHTKVPPRSIIPYILHYTQPGDLVLDLFCGSGMTGVAAQMCANPPTDILESFPELKNRVGPRACVLNDLSPAACHIAYNYNTPVDLKVLKREFERIKAAVKDEFDWLYGTEHYEPAVGLYDPCNEEVVSRLKNPPTVKKASSMRGQMVLEGHAHYGTQDWELLTKYEVENRLGYSVTELPRDDKWGELDVDKVKWWICIPATVEYTIWSDVYRCEGFVTVEENTGRISAKGKNAGKPIIKKARIARGCGCEIVLWDAAVDKTSGDIAESFKCLNCRQSWIRQNLTFVGIRAMMTNYTFDGLQPRRRFRPTTVREQKRLDEIESKATPWFPKDTILQERELMTMGAGRREIKSLADFYTPRNRLALARIYDLMSALSFHDNRLFRGLLFIFTSVVNTSSRLRFFMPSGPGAIRKSTLYVSALTSEVNVLESMSRKAEEIYDALRSFRQVEGVKVMNASARHLAPIQSESIDYIYTDPPFGGNIFYADASILWEGWLQQFTNLKEEMVYHRRSVAKKIAAGIYSSPEDYGRLMNDAFAEMARVLKPGHCCTVVFNNSEGRIFEMIRTAILHAGFEIDNMVLLDKVQKSFKQLQGASGEQDVVDKDVLFNLRKPLTDSRDRINKYHDLEQQIADGVRLHLQSLPERIKADPAKYNDEHRTTATINSMLMNTLIPRGVDVQRLNLPLIQRVCARYFRKVGQYWYLRGEAVGVNGGELLPEEITIKDEMTAIAWLRQKLESRPALIGELKPLWMRATGLLPATIFQSLVLETLLISNFWRDEETNRWREPTPVERDRMNDDKTIRVLHDAERYVTGSLRRQTTETERCEWIDTLFQMCRGLEENDAHVLPSIRDLAPEEGYRLIGRLFQGILKDKIPPAVYSRAAKQAGVASQRTVQNVEDNAEKSKAKRRKDEGPTLFDP